MNNLFSGEVALAHWREHEKATAELKEEMLRAGSGHVLVAVLGMATNPGGEEINREYTSRLNAGVLKAHELEEKGMNVTYLTTGAQTSYPGFDIYGAWTDHQPMGTMAKEYLLNQGVPEHQVFDLNALGFNECFSGADEIRAIKQIVSNPELIKLPDTLVQEVNVVLSNPTQQRYLLHALAHELPITPVWVDADYTDPLNPFNNQRFSGASLHAIQIYTKLFDAKWAKDSLIGKMIRRQRK